MPPNPYDKASRFAASKLEPEAFIGWLLNHHPKHTQHSGWLDTRGLPFPGEPDRVSDTVAHLEDASQHGVPWAVAIEFQTQPDPNMSTRLLRYLAELGLNRKPDEERGSRFQLGAAVVNLTGSGSTSRDMHWPAAGLHTLLKVVERNLEAESAEELLTGIESGRWSRCLLPWIPLMSGGGNTDTIDRWSKLGEAEPDRRRKAEFGGIALVFAEKVGRKEIWQQKLEGWNVEESTVVNEWIAKGEARSELRQTRTLILRLGAKRFGSAPAEVEAVIQNIQDGARLERIADRLFDANGWVDLVATT